MLAMHAPSVWMCGADGSRTPLDESGWSARGPRPQLVLVGHVQEAQRAASSSESTYTGMGGTKSARKYSRTSDVAGIVSASASAPVPSHPRVRRVRHASDRVGSSMAAAWVGAESGLIRYSPLTAIVDGSSRGNGDEVSEWEWEEEVWCCCKF